MTSPNHIAGGFFFTGFWCSFWHINIFEKPEFIAATIIASLLPDADHTKSPMGLALYPIAYAINRKFGHRTITHSLLFLFAGTYLTYLTTSSIKLETSNAFTLIFFFSVLSHFILDMVTTQGIPLLYPFFKNPCVIPGNPDYRFDSGKLRPELTAFFLFIGMNFLCYDLYANGFWTQFNRTMAQLPSVFDEYKNTPNFLLIDYNFVQDGKPHIGKGVVLYATYKEVNLLTISGTYKLTEQTPNQDIKHLKPERTKIPFKMDKINLFGVALDSLKSAIRNKYVTGIIQSEEPFFYDNNGIINRQSDLKITDAYNPNIYTGHTQVKTNDLASQITAKRYALAQRQANDIKAANRYYSIQTQISNLKSELANTNDIAERTVIENKLIKLNNSFATMQPPTPSDNSMLVAELTELQLKLNQEKNYRQTFNASISYPVLPTEILQQLTEKNKKK